MIYRSSGIDEWRLQHGVRPARARLGGLNHAENAPLQPDQFVLGIVAATDPAHRTTTPGPVHHTAPLFVRARHVHVSGTAASTAFLRTGRHARSDAVVHHRGGTVMSLSGAALASHPTTDGRLARRPAIASPVRPAHATIF